MNVEELRDYCLSLKSVEEKMPFGDNALVFSVRGKMFCLIDISTFDYINVKCEPDKAITLREEYIDVTPGYYMNKKHWNSVNPKGGIPENLLKEWIKDSYELVVSGLPKKTQRELNQD